MTRENDSFSAELSPVISRRQDVDADIIRIYAARCASWRGYFAVHTWIAVKTARSSRYTVYEIMGDRGRSRSKLVISNRQPNTHWFGAPPHLVLELSGRDVAGIISKIDEKARKYRWSHTYRAWPGPNSNTFVAHVVRAIPELAVALPSTMIGKDYLTPRLAGIAPSATGSQISLFGLLGILLAGDEGIEVNCLGLVFGFDFKHRAVKLPILGQVHILASHPGSVDNATGIAGQPLTYGDLEIPRRWRARGWGVGTPKIRDQDQTLVATIQREPFWRSVYPLALILTSIFAGMLLALA